MNQSKVKLGIFGGVTPQDDEAFKALLKTLNAGGTIEVLHIPSDHDTDRPRKGEALTDPAPNKMTTLVRSLNKDIRSLERKGVSLLVMPCSTVYRPEITSKLDAKCRMVDLGAALRTGITATKIGVISMEAAQPVFIQTWGKERVVLPEQDLLRSLINSSDKAQAFKTIIQDLVDKGAQAIVVGRSDARAYIKDCDSSVPVFDYLECLAQQVIKEIGMSRTQDSKGATLG